MEMARDVRALRSAEATSSKAATTRTPSSPPTPTMQPAPSRSRPTPTPAPADSAPRPLSTNEPAKMGADSTLKELERVKADAQNARAFEATVRGKLASAEADLQRAKAELQRTKDEAGRATKEAEQAKADAQSAREARAQRPRTNLLMQKQLERQSKSEKKFAKTPPKANQVSVPACDRGLAINRLIPKSLGAADAPEGALDRQPCRIRAAL